MTCGPSKNVAITYPIWQQKTIVAITSPAAAEKSAIFLSRQKIHTFLCRGRTSYRHNSFLFPYWICYCNIFRRPTRQTGLMWENNIFSFILASRTIFFFWYWLERQQKELKNWLPDVLNSWPHLRSRWVQTIKIGRLCCQTVPLMLY